MFYVLNIFIVLYTGSNHRNLYYNVATKLLVATALTCVVGVTLTLITFPSSTGVIQDIFAQITPTSTGNNSGNMTNGSSNVDQLSTLTSNTTNSSSVIQLATLSSYQPITPSSYSGGSTSNDNEESSDEVANDDETRDTNYSDDDDEDSSDYDDDNNDDNNDYDSNNGNTIVITSTGNFDNEDDDDDENSDYSESEETENDGYYYDDNRVGISLGSRGAFASAGGSGAFASAR